MRCARTHTAFLAAVLLLLSPLIRAQSRHTPTIDESLSLKGVSSPMISPDGRFVAYWMSETNWKDNEFTSQIWLANLARGATFQLTRGKRAPGPARWSPDGKWLAFVDEREPTAVEPLAEEKK